MIRRAAVEAPAKVNLRLAVLAREESGFHSLETIFTAISLADRLDVERRKAGLVLRVTGGVDVGPSDENLVLRAARLFYQRFGEEGALDLHLHKRIPAAAGLGGGSSDAAATLRALNALHEGPFDSDELLTMGALLGSDVPFFLGPTTHALAWGRGERLLGLRPPVSRHLLIAHPGVAIPTSEAFALLARLRTLEPLPTPVALDPRDLRRWDRLASLARNDFEVVARQQIGLYDEGATRMREGGASIALLAGSGASIFGVFPDRRLRNAARHELRRSGFTVWTAKTLKRWPDVQLWD